MNLWGRAMTIGHLDSTNCDLVRRGVETRDFDYKGPSRWDSKNKQACFGVAKDVLAMANSGGGTLVIGVNEADNKWDFAGVIPDDAKTWETTKFNNFINTCADPPINCTVRTIECDDRLFV